MSATLKAPFPYFGGKSRIAEAVWQRLGDVPNYVEPFFGSGAMLLGRPHKPRTETVNDLDGMVSNFWRALQADSDAVAHHADWPVSENDLHARHAWLVAQKESLQTRLEGNPEYYDVKIAGWWVWGISCWIGSGFCSGKGPWYSVDGELVKLEKSDAGKGVNRQLPHLICGVGVNRQLPHLGNAGRGVNRKRPHLGNAGRGVNRKRPHLGEYLGELSGRLRNVRVCCGDWQRVCGPSPTFTLGLTGIFLDPPYADTAGRDSNLYAQDSLSVAHDVRRWAIANGENPLLRIALCGYDTEHDMPETWECLEWKAKGGYGLQGNGAGRVNSSRECVWFSPHCLGVKQQMELI